MNKVEHSVSVDVDDDDDDDAGRLLYIAEGVSRMRAKGLVSCVMNKVVPIDVQTRKEFLSLQKVKK